MKLMTNLLALTLVLAVTGGAFAADEKKKGEGRKAPALQAVQVPKDVELSADQKEKLAAVNKEFAAKLADAQKEVDSVLTDEQKKARQAATKEAREKMKKGKEAKESIDAAIKLTDDQKAKYEKATAALAAIRTDALKKFGETLTAEQKTKFPGLAERKGKKAEKKKDTK